MELTQEAYENPKPSRRKIVLAALLIAVAVAVIIFGVSLTNREANTLDSEAPAPAAQVVINGSYSPQTIQIRRGQTILWTNEDNRPRTLSVDGAAAGAGGYGEAELIGQGETYSFVFDEPGTFNYYDSADPQQLRGVVIVE